MSALFAFLHHFAAFTVVAAIAIEFVLVRDVTEKSVRHLRIVDTLYGASAGLLVLVGLLRVFYFEKGASYYFHSIPFLVKLSLFVVVGLLSIYPTVAFASRKNIDENKWRTIRRIIHWELAAVVLILLCAALMARGIGFVG